jgi:UDP-glucose 4-epimerase
MPLLLVTGGCGFIGSHLVDALLAEGNDVRILDDLSSGRRANVDPRAQIVEGDVADLPSVEAALAGTEGCFHLAAVASVERSVKDWTRSHRTNAGGTVAVLDAARRRSTPVVYASSAAIYGVQERMPIAESALPAPLTPYGCDKLAGELHAAAAGRLSGLPTFGCRFFNVYGPRQDASSPYSGVISLFIDRARRGLPLGVNGSGRQSRDFIHVGDVVRMLIAGLAAASPAAPVVNVCTGRATTVAELAAAVVRLTASASPIEPRPARPGDIEHSVGDPGLARSLIGLEATTGLAAGLASL